MILSIVTICKNEVNSIEDTLVSVLQQSFKDYQYIVIDGDSNDGTRGIIKKYAKNIDVFISEPDGGIYTAMNKGLKYAKGEYILFLNGGDIFAHEKVVDNVRPFFGAVDILYGYLKTPDGQILKNYSNIDIRKHLTKGTLPHQATFVKRDVYLKTKGFNESYKIAGDYDFFVESILKYNVSTMYIPVMVTIFNLEGIAQNTPEIREAEKEIIKKKAIQYHSKNYKSITEIFFSNLAKKIL